jgi:hypothetical protein
MAWIVGSRKKKPESCPARMFTRVTFGATPAMPKSFTGEATVPATCVPWLFSSTVAGS